MYYINANFLILIIVLWLWKKISLFLENTHLNIWGKEELSVTNTQMVRKKALILYS